MMENFDLKGKIRCMEIGESLSVPLERLAVVRTYASELSLALGRVYKTRADKMARLVWVRRFE